MDVAISNVLLSNDRKTHLSLSQKHKTEKWTKKNIETLKEKSAMKFESILEYLELPCRPPIPTEKPSADLKEKDVYNAINGTYFKDDTNDDDPYQHVFTWLRKENVSKIFKVEVDDIGDDPLNTKIVPHSNHSIRKSLKGFEVEVLDWKKFDLCANTIFQAAEDVRELHLYSSGNTAVLRGWASAEDGLSRLQSLKSLSLAIYPPSQSDYQDCQAYQEKFIEKLTTSCPMLKSQGGSITIAYKDISSDKSSAIDFKDHTGEKKSGDLRSEARAESWQKQMKCFVDTVRETYTKVQQVSKELKENCRVKNIKVAVIDDGVNLDFDGVQGIVQVQGKSFCSDDQPHFSQGSGHGTIMILTIRSICPQADLLVGRLDDSRKSENQRFTVKSACEALKWAIDWNANIISMSWSVKMEDNEGDDFANFKSLLHEADSKSIIIFASMADKGPQENQEGRLPVGHPKVIRIAAATQNGERAPKNFTGEPEFLFPGEQVRLPGISDPVSGSSVATAFASGLAALILQCVELHTQDELERDDTLKSRLVRLAPATPDGMRMVLKSLCKEHLNWKDYFVQPYNYFNECKPVEDGDYERRTAIKDFLNTVSILALGN